MLRVDGNARHWTHLNTLRFVKMSDTLGAFGRVDFIDLLAQINSLVGAFGLTHIAIDAFIGDHQGHASGSLQVGVKFHERIIGHLQHPKYWQGCLDQRTFQVDRHRHGQTPKMRHWKSS